MFNIYTCRSLHILFLTHVSDATIHLHDATTHLHDVLMYIYDVLLPPLTHTHPVTLTDQKTMKCEYENALVLIVEKKISG